MSKKCSVLHDLAHSSLRLSFRDDFSRLPEDGIYLLFEHGESGHGGDRIVRVGSHTGDKQLQPRLRQHFLVENKDRSIFRKNIGRAILSASGDPFLADWELDLTTRKARQLHEERIDTEKKMAIEQQVSRCIQDKFSFVVIPQPDPRVRLSLETKMISTVAGCDICSSSETWLGRQSPTVKIRERGLWQVMGLDKEPLSDQELEGLTGQFWTG